MKKYSTLKPSGNDWLGDIPEGWEIKRSKYLGHAIIGLTYSPDEVVNEGEGVLILRSSNIQNGHIVFSDNVYVKKDIPENLITKFGDILICSRNGSVKLIGKNALIDKNTVGLSFGAFMTIFRSEYYRFLYYFFNSNLFTAQSGLFSTSTINQLTTTILNNMEIPIPPPDTQLAIVEFLNEKTPKIDDLVTKKQKLIDLLKEERSAVINQAVTKGLDVDVEMKDSGIEWLDQIPKHWNITPFFVMFKEHKHKNKGNIIKKVLSLSYGKIVIRNTENNFGLLPESFEGYNIVDVGNIVLRLTDLQNDHKSLRCGLVREKGIITSAYTTIECDKRINAEYAYYLLHVYDLLKVFYGMGGGVRQSIDYPDLKKMPILLPPYEEQVGIANYVNSMISKIDNNITKMLMEISLLQEYRKTLISEVVTGKIDVRQEVVS